MLRNWRRGVGCYGCRVFYFNFFLCGWSLDTLDFYGLLVLWFILIELIDGCSKGPVHLVTQRIESVHFRPKRNQPVLSGVCACLIDDVGMISVEYSVSQFLEIEFAGFDSVYVTFWNPWSLAEHRLVVKQALTYLQLACQNRSNCLFIVEVWLSAAASIRFKIWIFFLQSFHV